jgi:hypothetical protein
MFMGFSCVRCMYILLLFPHESVCLQNMFVFFKFYIYTDGIVLLWSWHGHPGRPGMLQCIKFDKSLSVA